MPRRRAPAALCCATLLCGATAAAAPSPRRPHILFILADDLGYGDLGYVGSDIETPRIDALATAGTVLNRYYVLAGCTPTRAALQTGRYPIRYGLQLGTIPVNKPYGLDLSEKMLPHYLKEQGYSTHMIGKWHLGLYRWAYTPSFRGYDTFMGYYSGAEDYYTHDTCESECVFDLHLDARPNCGTGCTHPLLELRGNYSARIFGDRAVTIVKDCDASTPLFLLAAFQSVHFPIQAPEEYVRPYAHLDPNRRVFAGMLAALDEQVGRIVDEFTAKGMWDDTVTVFSTDNGGPVGSRGGRPWGPWCATGAQNWPLRGGKGTHYEGGVRGTGWVHGRMLARRGGSTNGLMHVTDWVPTLVAAAGGAASPPAGHPLDGVNQWPLLTQPSAASSRADLLVNMNKYSGGFGGAVVVGAEGQHKLCVGRCGLPNTWYHDGLPYSGNESTPQNQCVQTGNSPCNGCAWGPDGPTGAGGAPGCSDGCLPAPEGVHEVFDILADPEERRDLAANTTLVAALYAVATRYNATPYAEPLITTPANPYGCQANKSCCPYAVPAAGDPQGVLTPCD